MKKKSKNIIFSPLRARKIGLKPPVLERVTEPFIPILLGLRARKRGTLKVNLVGARFYSRKKEGFYEGKWRWEKGRKERIVKVNMLQGVYI